MSRMIAVSLALLLGLASPALAQPSAAEAALRETAAATLQRYDVSRAEAEAALATLERLAEGGDVVAMGALAITWENGVGEHFPSDMAKAATWNRKGAEAGDPAQMSFWARKLLKGIGVPADAAAAVGWYRRAAAKGEVFAELGLAELLRAGAPGVPAAPAEAATIARRLAGQDVPAALVMLAEMYEDGQGVTQDYVQARIWHRRAFENAAFPNPERLARLYERGLGGPVDRVTAYAYYAQCESESGKASAARLWESFDTNARRKGKTLAEDLKTPGL